MAEITAAMVKEFRNKTGLPMMECKKALVEADGDQEKAIEIIRKAGKKTMEKRADRETEAGRIAIYKGSNGVTSMVEVLCESAPVTKNAEFIELIEGIAKQLAEGPGAATPEELMAQSFPGKDSIIQVVFDDLVNKIRQKFFALRVFCVLRGTSAPMFITTMPSVSFSRSKETTPNWLTTSVCTSLR